MLGSVELSLSKPLAKVRGWSVSCGGSPLVSTGFGHGFGVGPKHGHRQHLSGSRCNFTHARQFSLSEIA